MRKIPEILGGGVMGESSDDDKNVPKLMRMEPNIEATRRETFRDAEQVEQSAAKVEEAHEADALEDGENVGVVEAEEKEGVRGGDDAESTESNIHQGADGAPLGSSGEVHESEHGTAGAQQNGQGNVQEAEVAEGAEVPHDGEVGAGDENGDASVVQLAEEGQDVVALDGAVQMEDGRAGQADLGRQQVDDQGPGRGFAACCFHLGGHLLQESVQLDLDAVVVVLHSGLEAVPLLEALVGQALLAIRKQHRHLLAQLSQFLQVMGQRLLGFCHIIVSNVFPLPLQLGDLCHEAMKINRVVMFSQ